MAHKGPKRGQRMATNYKNRKKKMPKVKKMGRKKGY